MHYRGQGYGICRLYVQLSEMPNKIILASEQKCNIYIYIYYYLQCYLQCYYMLAVQQPTNCT